MDEHAVLVANIIIGSLLATTVGFAAAWMRVRERAIRAEMAQRLPQDVEARFESLQRAVDAIAIEVERISEAQRFSAKLLAERSPASAERPRVPGQVTTPH
jgi:hypothetical protein